MDLTHFENCKYRSPDEELYFEQLCCGVNTCVGYACRKLQIHANAENMPRYCEMCIHYEKKEN